MISDWQIKILGDVCEFYNGKAHEKIIDESGKYFVINSKFISSNGEIVKKTNSMLFPLYTGDIVMVMSDVPNGQALSKCFLVDKDDTYSLNQRICAIRSTNFDKKFLYYQLNRNRYFLEFNNGENQTNLRKNEILNCPLLIPPLPEQKRIVGILDKAFAAISTAKANAEKNLQNARELFESYLQGVFANPGDGWEVKKLGEVCDISTGKWDANHAVENGEFRFFTCAREPKLCDTKRFSGECLVLPGNGVNVGDVYYYKGNFDAYQRTYVISKIKPYTKYLFYHMLAFWKKRNLNKQYGSATNFLKIGNFNEYEIPLPPLPEQRYIVAKLDTLSAETKKIEAIYQQKIADFDELKKSVLQKAFNGELAGACA